MSEASASGRESERPAQHGGFQCPVSVNSKPWHQHLKLVLRGGSLAAVAAVLASCAEETASQSPFASSRSNLVALPGDLATSSGALGAPAAVPVSAPTIPPSSSTRPSTVWVMMRQKADLVKARASRDWKGRGQSVYNGLTATAVASQANVRTYLTSRGAKFKPFWIANALRVTADQATIDALATRSDVAGILADTPFAIPPYQRTAQIHSDRAVEWNLANIRVPETWALGATGDQIVVANIDTGVEFHHPALVRQYRGNVGNGTFNHNYNWFDPANVCGLPSTVPCDNMFHGTHTMGVLVGDDQNGNQIGVAPHAIWIAAKGCENKSCSMESLLAAGQWVLAPTDLRGQNPRPDLRPHIVNNSWGQDAGHNLFFQATVQAWMAAGIFPVFAGGNSGSACGSVSSPGDYPESYAVGAYDPTNTIAYFSGRGTALDGTIKPNISAPGVDVRSSVPGGGYDTVSGTSMAAPHLAGAVALLWSVAPLMIGDITGTRALLDASAIDNPDLSCGGTAENNNTFGEGRLDVLRAVSQAPQRPSGILRGTVVTSAGGDAVARAVIQAVGATEHRVTTDSAGAYTMALPQGVYSLTARAFGFLSQTRDGVAVAVDATEVQNLSLQRAPSFALSGTISDQSGAPLPGAQVTIADSGIPTATTDGAGHYLFPSVPAGEYLITARVERCYDNLTRSATLSTAQVLDFVLPQRVDAFGYRCHLPAYEFIEADTVLPLFGSFGSALVSLPFPFPFYGRVYSAAGVTTSGYLEFVTSTAPGYHTAIPDPGPPNAAIYAFWNELLFVDTQASVRTQTVGTAPNRRFVIEWRDVLLPDNGGGLRVTFEIVLSENGQIVTQYHSAGPEVSQRGGSATTGIENESGSVALPYSVNQPVLSSRLAIAYSVAPWGSVRGKVTDANDGSPVGGAQLKLVRSDGTAAQTTVSASDGAYQFVQALVGAYDLEVTFGGYPSQKVAVTVADNGVVQQDFALETGRAVLTPATVQMTIPANQRRTRVLRLTNTGSMAVEYAVYEAGGARQNTVSTATLVRNPAAGAQAWNTRGLFTPGASVAGMKPMAMGEVIRSFEPTSMGLAFGVGYNGKVWLGDFFSQRNVEFTTEGALSGRGWATPWGTYIADMAYVAAHKLLCQVNVIEEKGIYCLDPSNGNVVQKITGTFAWTVNSQLGLAYRSRDDTFYIGGWNEGVIYHVKGLSSTNPGEVIGSCRPGDGNISGLAYNDAAGVLWAATNSPTDTIYQLNPDDCTVLGTVGHPAPGFNGGGLDMDESGNLWTVSQIPNRIYLMDSGVPALADVPWLSFVATGEMVTPGASQSLRVTVDTTGLTPGLYLANVVVRTSAARQRLLRIPVSVLVPDYQQAVNVGGGTYTDTLGDGWAADRRHNAGGWGYVQRGSTETSSRSISGTTDPTLFRSQRLDPYAYRFDNIPNGIYQVEFAFCEYQNLRPGRRLFDVTVEDTVVLPAHDITSEVGRFAADQHSFFVKVTDGRMDVRLVARAGSEPPLLNALRITHRVDR